MDFRRQNRLQHAIFEIGMYLGANLADLFRRDLKLHEHLLDTVGGTVDLYTNHAYRWAIEFEDLHPTGSEDFIGDIDTFTSMKFDRLVETVSAKIIIGIQVVPTYEQSDRVGGTETVVQSGGPDGDTERWSVYERDSSGAARWVADLVDEDIAMRVGAVLAAQHGVEIEPQLWRKTA